jgi:hypothetical protein
MSDFRDKLKKGMVFTGVKNVKYIYLGNYQNLLKDNVNGYLYAMLGDIPDNIATNTIYIQTTLSEAVFSSGLNGMFVFTKQPKKFCQSLGMVDISSLHHVLSKIWAYQRIDKPK